MLLSLSSCVRTMKVFFYPSRLVLAIGVFTSIAAAFFVDLSVMKKMREENLSYLEKASADIQLALEQYLHPLQGTSGLYFAYDNEVEASVFRKYAIARGLFHNFRGALGFGFIRRVDSASLPKYLMKIRGERPGFDLRRLRESSFSPQPEALFIIEVVEPIERNERAIGLVISDEKHRFDAAVHSMHTGRPTLTKSIQLVQANKKEPGFLLYLPMYASPVPPETEKERVEKLIGWSYAPILVSELFAFVTSRNILAPPFKINEVNEEGGKNLLYQAKAMDQSQSQADLWSQKFEVAGQIWEISSNLSGGSNSYLDHLWGLVALVLSGMISYIAFSRVKNLEKESTQKKEVLQVAQLEVEKATQELRYKTNFLQKIINSIPAIVAYWDRDRYNKLCNQAYAQYFGLQPSEVLGKHMSEVLPSEVYSKNEVYIKAALDGLISEYEGVLPDVTGKEATLMVKYLPDVKDNVIVGYLTIAVDISKIRDLEVKAHEAQAQLYNNARLSMLGEMAAGVAHEINNPLAIIGGKAQVLSIQIRNLALAEREKALQKNVQAIVKTVDRIAAIIGGLRAFSDDPNDRPYAVINVKKILEDVLSLTSERILHRGISLSMEIPEGDLSLFCHEYQLVQVLIHLISNSIDALEKNQNKWIKVSITESSTDICFRVPDGGQGIPANIVGKMMQPFFTTKEIGKGLGLGLSVSKGIVDRHRGKISYDPINGYTSFIFSIPKQKTDVIPLGGAA